jgi:lipopolysaccharide/colanic/teichoic acid biosynthesis glycosyltransferase
MKTFFSVFHFNNKHIFNATGRLLPESVFWLLLQRERFLADRGGRNFALVIFHLDADKHELFPFNQLVDAIIERLRCSDAAGWIDKNRVGALLAQSNPGDAYRVVEEIRRQLEPGHPLPRYEVYAYPADRGQTELAKQQHFSTLSCAASALSHESSLPVIADAAHVYPLFAPDYPRWKRVLDVAGALALIALASPVMLLTATYIKLVSRGPALFRQPRMGRACNTFLCFKFRTMRVDADTGVHARHVQDLMKEDRPLTKLDQRKDKRLIPFGRYLRAAGLDELPQLFNVLRGEMSLVGPRPCLDYEYHDLASWQLRRFDTRPGLTGLWQVNGKNRTTFLQMMRYDARYAARPSLWHDVGIIFRTLPVVLGQVADAAWPHLRREAA